MHRKILSLLVAVSLLFLNIGNVYAASGHAVVLTDQEMDMVWARGFNNFENINNFLGSSGNTASNLGSGKIQVKQPNSPNKPTVVQKPNTDIVVFKPKQPTEVTRPSTPTTVNVPTTPTTPTQPTVPTQVSTPATPATPNVPTPVVDPIPAVTPLSTSAPNVPVGAAAPTDPVGGVSPAVVSVPNTPATPNLPTEVNVPVVVSAPSAPSTPSTPSAPATPSTPQQPSLPADIVAVQPVMEFDITAAGGQDVSYSVDNTPPTYLMDAGSAAGQNVIYMSDQAQNGMSSFVNVNAAGSIVPVMINLTIVTDADVVNVVNSNDLSVVNYQ